jgi:flavin-binding protein dodecin
MSEALILDGGQKERLKEAIINAYPNFDELRMLLSERMNVQVEAIARGETNESRVFNLIEKFQSEGRIGEFIRVVVEKKPNSPFFTELKNEFATILGKDNTDEKNQQQPPKRNNGESNIWEQDGRLEDTNVKRYREQVKQYLSDRWLEDYERDLLDVLRDELGLSPEKANQILEEELAPIYQARQAYERGLKTLIKYYPFSDGVKSELKKFQVQRNLTDREVNEISQPILEQAEIAYQEKLQQQAYTPTILRSARGIDYSELAELLKQQKWKEADKLTYKVMLEVANRSSEGWLRVEGYCQLNERG